MNRFVLALLSVLLLFPLLLCSQAHQAQMHASPSVQSASAPDSGTAASAQGRGLVHCSPTPVALSIGGGTIPEDKTDPEQAEHFCRAINDLFEQEQFDKLDQIAQEARTSRSRFAGGGWKLYSLYSMISGIGANASEAEWEARFARLNRWIAAKPNSVTPRIALSSAYNDYAWKVRGSGYANEVTPEGWKLFSERLRRAQELLENTAGLPARDPQYYLIMVRIARGQQWERAATDRLLDQAIALEPGYYYVYQEYAIGLMRHWSGGEGEATRFAGEIADRVGGEEGDIVYFHIAHTFAAFDFDYLIALSWPRIQRGFQSMESEYGSSPMKLNWFCQIATFMDKQLDAANLFDRIGESWDEDTWGSRFNFDEPRQIAQSMRNLNATALSSPTRQFNSSTANLFRQRYSGMVSECVSGADRVPQAFNVYIQIKADGGIMNAELLNDQDLIYCLDLKLFHTQFPLPPPESLIEPDKTFTWVRIAMTRPQAKDSE